MATIMYSLVIAIVGALTYALAGGKASELGRIAYFVGLLWLVQQLAHTVVHF